MEPMIAIVGHIDVDPAVRDDVVAATVALQEKTRNEEPGCLTYAMSADPVLPGRIQIVELWRTAADLAAHFQHQNFFDTGAAMRAFPRIGGSAIKYRIDAVDPVKGDDGLASVDFWSVQG